MNEYMSRKNLREVGLEQIIDCLPVQTDYGKDHKERMFPHSHSQIEDLRRIYREMGIFRRGLKSSQSILWNLKGFLSEFKDLRGSLKRVMDQEILNEVELFEIKNQIMVMEELLEFLRRYPQLSLEKFQMESLAPLIKALDPEGSRVRTFYIYDSYSNRLYELREKKRKITGRIQEIQNQLRQKVFEELEIKPKMNNEVLIPKEDRSMAKRAEECSLVYFLSETYRSYVFKIVPTDEVILLREESQKLKMEEEEEEFEIRKILTQRVRDFIDEINKNIHIIGELDLTIGKILLGDDMRGVEPRIVDDPYIHFLKGRHSVVEHRLHQEGKEYMPVDISLEEGVTIVTGANMGGKTITLKLIALIAGMAQLGLYVPAQEATVGPFSFVYFSSGDGQSEEQGLSTFGSEIYHLKNLTDDQQSNGLILLDELGRGTNPSEGYGISYGVIEYFKQVIGITVVTTHLDGLTQIKGVKHLQVVGLRNRKPEEIKEVLDKAGDGKGRLEDLMDYRLEHGEADREVPKEAMMIARLMGLNEKILEKAEKALKTKKQEMD